MPNFISRMSTLRRSLLVSAIALVAVATAVSATSVGTSITTIGLTATGSATLGDAVADGVILNGRLSTGSAAGAALTLDSTYAYTEGAELRYTVTDWTGIGATNTFDAMYLRGQVNTAAAAGNLKGLELYASNNGVALGSMHGAYIETHVKPIAANATVGPIYGLEANVSLYAPTAGTLTLTEQSDVGTAAGRFQLGLNSGLADYTSVYGVLIQSNDGSVGSRTLGSGLLIRNYPAEGTQTWTKGIQITAPAVTGLSLEGAMTTGIDIAGASTTDIKLQNDETIDNASNGVVAITSPSTTFSGDITVTGDDITMTTNTSGAVLVADGTNFNPVVMGGDATIGTTGTLAIASNAVQGTDISLASEAAGDIMYANGTDWVRLGIGTALQVLRTNAGATAPEWATMVAALDNASAWTAIQKLDAGITVDTDNFIVDGTTGAVTAEGGITLSGPTGVNELRVPTNLADALSIEDTAGDLMVFDTTTGAQRVTITPAVTITGAQTLTGVTTHGANVVSDTDSTDSLGLTGTRWANAFVDTYTGTGLTFDGATTVNVLTIPDNVADALSIVNAGGDVLVFDTSNGAEVLTLTAGNISVSAGEVGASKTRTTGLTGSFQTIWGDLTYEGAAGGTSSYHAGVMGNFLGDNLTNTNPAMHAGVIGKYSVTTGDTSAGPQAGLVGELETDFGDAAIMAVLSGNSATATPNAAYGVQYLMTVVGPKFDYGLDLSHAQTVGLGAETIVSYGTADIRLQNGETISNGTNGTVAVGGNLLVNGARISNTSGEEKFLSVTGNLTGVGDVSNNAKTWVIKADATRLAGANTINGDFDDALFKGSITNKATGNEANYIMRGLNIGATNRDGGNVNKLHGGHISATQKGSSNVVTDLWGLSVKVEADSPNTAPTNVFGLNVEYDMVAPTGAPTLSAGVRVLNNSDIAIAASDPLAGFMVDNGAADRQWQYGLYIDDTTVTKANIRLSTGVVIASGAGAPSSSGGAANTCNLGAGLTDFPRGSLYLRTDPTGANDAMYVCTATDTWTAK